MSSYSPLNYTIGGEPVALYGMFLITTVIMAYVTLSGPSSSSEEEKGEEEYEAESEKEEVYEEESPEEPEEDTSMVPGLGMMPTEVDTASVENKPSEANQEEAPEEAPKENTPPPNETKGGARKMRHSKRNKKPKKASNKSLKRR